MGNLSKDAQLKKNASSAGKGRPKMDPMEVRSKTIKIRANPKEEAKFKLLGGNDWFRKMLNNERA